MNEAVRQEPNESFYHFWLGDLYLQLDRHPEALRELQAAVIHSPYDDYYCVRLGLAYSPMDRGEDAVAIFQRGIRLRPGNASYHCLLADAFARIDRMTAQMVRTGVPSNAVELFVIDERE